MDFARDCNGKLAALEVEDQLTGERFQVRAKVFVNCTGPFADQLRRMANPILPERLRLSKGVHLLLPLEALQSDAALLIPSTEDGRVIFAIPWLGRLLVGTTDDEAKVTDEMVVTPAEVRYLLRHVNQYLKETLTPQDVLSAFAGLRPLLKSKASVNTGKLTRDHEVEVDAASGLISVMGGKWTTYRAMAEDGIDCVQRALGAGPAECRTLDFPLSGAEGFWVDYWRQLAEKIRSVFALRPPPGAEVRHRCAQGIGAGRRRAAAVAAALTGRRRHPRRGGVCHPRGDGADHRRHSRAQNRRAIARLEGSGGNCARRGTIARPRICLE